MALFSFNGNRNTDRNKRKKTKESIVGAEQTVEYDDSDISESTETELTDLIDAEESEPDYEADYQAYLDFFNSIYHPFDGTPISFEEFKEVNYTEPENESNRLGFTPASVMKIGRAAAVAYAQDRGARLIAAATSGDPSAVQAELQGILDAGGNVINVMKGSGGSNDGNSVPPGTVPNSSNMKFVSHHQLNLEPRPVEVSFNSGIETNVYAPYNLDTIAGFSPMHISHAKLKFSKLLAGSKMSNYFQYVITFWFQIAAQRNVSFNVNAASTFNTANLLLYLDAITDAIQIYYFYTSIITYCSNINNGNEAMRTLRSYLLADDMDYLLMIRDRLARMPIPPNLKTLLFWMNQTYQESSMPGSPIIKIMPVPFGTSLDANYLFNALNSNYIIGVFTALNSDPVNNIANLLAKIVPEWTKQPLDAPSGVSLHDPQFNTLFANLPNPGSSITGTYTRTPAVSGSDNNANYCTFTNSLDGAMLGLFTAYDATITNWTPGLLDITLLSGYATTRACTRISYLNGVSGKGFYPANSDGSCPMYRGETYYTTTAANTFIPYGSEQVYGVNINSVSETGYQLLKWLMSLDTLESATGGRSSSGSKSSKGESKGKKRFSRNNNAKPENPDVNSVV